MWGEVNKGDFTCIIKNFFFTRKMSSCITCVIKQYKKKRAKY